MLQEQEEYFDPKIDFVFKRIFGSNVFNFIDFANKVLNVPDEHKIISAEFLNLEIQKAIEDDKESRLDVLAKLNDGTFVHIEMQCAPQLYYEKRGLFYWSRIYSDQLKSGMKYKDLKKTISIHVLDFILYPDTPGFHSHITMTDKNHNHIQRFSDIEIHVLELKKISKTCYDGPDPLEQWALFLKEPSKESLEALSMQNPAIAQAVHDLQILSRDREAKVLYEARRKYWLDHNCEIEDAQEIGMQEGLQKGLQEGLQKGLQEGELKTKLKIAGEMKARGIPAAMILEITQLTEKQIADL